jgi:ribosomal protein S18 acetylase RimI-like enzyme
VAERVHDPTERVFELTGCFGVRLDETRKPELQELYDGCHAYFELVTGAPPGPDEAGALLKTVPRGKSADDKFVIGFFDAPGHLVGVLDVIRDYPRAGEWYMGLLLFGPSSRGRGLGERVYRRLEEWVRAEGGRALHLIVQQSNPGALRFWERMGFEVTGMGKQVLRGKELPFLKMTRTIAPGAEATGTFVKSWLAAWRRARGRPDDR